jgi:manganese/iron transport system permease protein
VIVMALGIGAGTSFLGAYLSYFLDGATGGIIVVLQTAIFLIAFFLAPKHGMLASRRRLKASLKDAAPEGAPPERAIQENAAQENAA